MKTEKPGIWLFICNNKINKLTAFFGAVQTLSLKKVYCRRTLTSSNYEGTFYQVLLYDIVTRREKGNELIYIISNTIVNIIYISLRQIKYTLSIVLYCIVLRRYTQFIHYPFHKKRLQYGRQGVEFHVKWHRPLQMVYQKRRARGEANVFSIEQKSFGSHTFF